MPKKVEVPEDATDLPVPADGLSEVEWRGEKFVFPTDQSEWPTRAMQAFSAQRFPDGVERLLGPQQWERLNELGPAMKDFWDFVTVFAAAAGFDKE
jgi:hypothetical protein